MILRTGSSLLYSGQDWEDSTELNKKNSVNYGKKGTVPEVQMQINCSAWLEFQWEKRD